jgi:hypothetical protein
MYVLYSYDRSGEQWQRGYEERFLEYLEKLIRDLDRRVQRGKERLQRSADANSKAFDDKDSMLYSEKLQTLGEKIAALIEESEELGRQGDVEEAQRLITRVEELEKEKERQRAQLMNWSLIPSTVAGFEVDPGNFHEKNEICDICGCFLIIGDSQARIDAHLMGKQHMGYARIRNTIAELKVSVASSFVIEERRPNYFIAFFKIMFKPIDYN